MICGLDLYRVLTRDSVSFDEDVEPALARAQKMLEEKTNRFYELLDEDGNPIVRTEKLRIHSDGRVYPHASPVRSVVLPIPPATTVSSIVTPQWQTWGMSSWILWRASNHNRTWRVDTIPQQYGVVTYTGGYEPDEIPEELKRCVAEMARFDVQQRLVLSEYPTGTSNMQIGDVKFSGTDLGLAPSLPKSIVSVLRKWRYKEV